MPASISPALRHPIGVVARRTGLKPDLIRAWERRYGAIAPGRTETRRRLYSDDDVARLLLLKRVVDTGRPIGQVAALSGPELESLLDGEPLLRPSSSLLVPVADEAAEELLQACLAAARRLEVTELELLLERASLRLGRVALVDRLLAPLLWRIGDLWRQGELRPSHEHMASAVVRSFLGGLSGLHDAPATAPSLLVTTPPRQRHELGALMVAATAAAEGWRVTYLGPDLPAEEIAAAAREKGSRAVALSVVHPPDDALLPDDLRRLKRLLPSGVELIVGGRAAGSYAPVLAEIGARHLEDLGALRPALEALRAPGLPASGPS